MKKLSRVMLWSWLGVMAVTLGMGGRSLWWSDSFLVAYPTGQVRMESFGGTVQLRLQKYPSGRYDLSVRSPHAFLFIEDCLIVGVYSSQLGSPFEYILLPRRLFPVELIAARPPTFRRGDWRPRLWWGDETSSFGTPTGGFLVHASGHYGHLLLLQSLPFAPILFRRIRRRRRLRRGLCLACGYDLRASARDCPECGAARVVPG